MAVGTKLAFSKGQLGGPVQFWIRRYAPDNRCLPRPLASRTRCDSRMAQREWKLSQHGLCVPHRLAILDLFKDVVATSGGPHPYAFTCFSREYPVCCFRLLPSDCIWTQGTVTRAADQDWDVLASFLPTNYQELATRAGALHGLHKDKSPESLRCSSTWGAGTRCGKLWCSRVWPTCRRWPFSSDCGSRATGAMRCVRHCFRSMAWPYGHARGAMLPSYASRPGSIGRLQYSITLPSLRCVFLRLKETKGAGPGELFKHFAVRAGDYILADRGYVTAPWHGVCGGLQWLRDGASAPRCIAF